MIQIYFSNMVTFKNSMRDFLGGAVVKNLPASAGDMGSIPCPGGSHMRRSNYVCVPQLLSLRSRAREPQLLSPCATTTRARVPQLLSPCAATTESCVPRARAPQQEKPPQ